MDRERVQSLSGQQATTKRPQHRQKSGAWWGVQRRGQISDRHGSLFPSPRDQSGLHRFPLRQKHKLMFRTFPIKYWLVAIWMIAGAFTAFAQFQQPRIKELPVVIKPRERPTTERVIVVTKPVQPSRGVLAVVLSQYVNAQVIVKDLNGRVLDQKDAGDQGQAEFQLRRGKVYEVEASYPGFLSVSSKSKPLGVSSIVRLTLVPQFASLKFRNLPTGAQVLIDDKQSATADQTGDVTISDIAPGSHHSLAIRHPEYNDYTDTLPELAAGAEYSYGKIPLTRVAKLTILGPPGATI